MRLALLTAAMAGLLLGGVAAEAGSSKPALRLVSMKPLVVQGQRFLPGERVAVTLYSNRTTARRAVAGRTGSFRVSFGEETYDRCSFPFVRAVGARGSRAALKLPMPACLLE